jgi:hypothetical protein
MSVPLGARSRVIGLLAVAASLVAFAWFVPPGAGATEAGGHAGSFAHVGHEGRVRSRRRTSPATVPKATGDKATIAFYRKLVAATVAADGVEQIYLAQAPLTQVKYSSKEGLAWYVMQPPKEGFAPALDIVFVGAEHGKVTFVADTVAYGGKGPAFPPFGMLLTPKGEVILAGGAPARTTPAGTKTPVTPCAGPTKVAFVAGYAKVGVPFGYSLLGHFAPMKRVGKYYDITSTYPWGAKPARTATEIDTVPVGSYLPTAGVIHVSAGGGFAAFTMRWANAWFHTTLYPPKTNGACASYVRGVP